MVNQLEVIRSIIAFHHNLRERYKIVGGSMSDLEALFSLRGEYAGRAQITLEALTAKQQILQETLAFLEDGLLKHFVFEEQNLSEILGNNLMKALFFQHNKLRETIKSTKAVVFTPLDNIGREEVIQHKSRFQQLMDDLGDSIERHAANEEIVLDWARQGIEEG